MTALAANDATEETRTAPGTRRRDRAGTLIRHAASGTTLPIDTLTIAMVKTSLGRLLVSTIGPGGAVLAGLGSGNASCSSTVPDRSSGKCGRQHHSRWRGRTAVGEQLRK